MPLELWHEITIHLLEDLHSGTGSGTGTGLDAEHIRDRHGRPILRETHIRGVWKDSGRELLRLRGIQSHSLDRVFGKAASRAGNSLVLPSPRWDDANPTGPQTRVWSSSARQPLSRRPKEDMLHSREYVAAGSKFKTRFYLRGKNQAELDADKKTLRDSIKGSPRLGAGRNRGGGLVRIELNDAVGPPDVNKIVPDSRNGDLRLRLLLQALDPLCLPATGNPGNIIPSENYIRGRRLLRSLADWAIFKEKSQIAELLLLGKISVSNALPIPPVTPRSGEDLSCFDVLPVPSHLRRKKPSSSSDGWPWWCEGGEPVEYENAFAQAHQASKSDIADMKGPRSSDYLFRRSEGSNWVKFSPLLQVHLRNRTPEDRSKDEGDLFSEEEIAEDTQFLADLNFTSKDDLTSFLDAFDLVLKGQSWLTIGRHRRPMRVEAAVSLPKIEFKKKPRADNPTRLVVTAESDLILRGPCLGFFDSLSWSALRAGIENRNQSAPVIKERAFSESIEIRGFNYLTGLPTAPQIAVRAGSSLLLEGEGVNQLRELLQGMPDGIGERCWEGFGRFRLDFAEPDLSPPASESSARADREEEILECVNDACRNFDAVTGDRLSKSQWAALAEMLQSEIERNNQIDNCLSAWKQRFPQNQDLELLEGELAKLLRTHQTELSLFVEVLTRRLRMKRSDSSRSNEHV